MAFEQGKQETFQHWNGAEAEWAGEQGMTDNGRNVAENEARMYLLCWEDVADQKHRGRPYFLYQ